MNITELKLFHSELKFRHLFFCYVFPEEQKEPKKLLKLNML